MLFSTIRHIPTLQRVGQSFLVSYVYLSASFGSFILPNDALAKNATLHAENTAPSPHSNKPNPELLLIEVYKNLSANDFQKAQSKLDELLIAYPNFQLGHLIRGDLITVRTRPAKVFGNSTNVLPNKYKDLRDEALARIKAIKERPSPDAIPSGLLQMANDQKYALVMDAKRARIFLYENVGGTPKLVSDFYVSQGKLGIDKYKEGDQKTPLGLYSITNRLPGTKLPDFYGPGALPINYPNEWDKVNGRSGSGIWLHGVPSGNYSRPPLASDGCIVLTNADFLHIAATIEVGKTPVLIHENIHFLSPAQWAEEKQIAQKLISDWRTDVESGNANRVATHYSKNMRFPIGENFNTWLQKQLIDTNKWIPSIKLKDLSLYKYPGKQDIIVSNFTQETTLNRSVIIDKKRQYWMKEATHWRIILEEQIHISGNKPEMAIVKTIDSKDIKTLATNNSVAVAATSEISTKNSEQPAILKTIDHWVAAWSGKNTSGYLAHYAKDFQPPNGETRKAWAEECRNRIEGKGKISVRIEKPIIIISGQTATIKFRQFYQSGALKASSRKTLMMSKQDGKWLIKQEATGR